MSGIRIDRWLWAARFFKTRSLAKKAVEGGRVQVENQRAKPSKELQISQNLAPDPARRNRSNHCRNGLVRPARACDSGSNAL